MERKATEGSLLTFVLFQLSVIVPAFALGNDSPNEPLAERRTGSQWLRSIAAYLDYKTGDSWRRLSDPQHRWDPDRLWYLNGIQLVRSFLADTSGEIGIVLPPLTPARLQSLEEKTNDLRAAKLALLPRVELVDKLLRADASLSDRKLLMGLSRPKLARMLVAAQDANAEALERTA